MYGRSVTIRFDEFALQLMVDALAREMEYRRKLQLVARDIMDRDGWALLRLERRALSAALSAIVGAQVCLPDDRGAMASQLRLNVLDTRNSIPRSKANEHRHAEMVAAWKRQG